MRRSSSQPAAAAIVDPDDPLLPARLSTEFRDTEGRTWTVTDFYVASDTRELVDTMIGWTIATHRGFASGNYRVLYEFAEDSLADHKTVVPLLMRQFAAGRSVSARARSNEAVSVAKAPTLAQRNQERPGRRGMGSR